MGMIRAEKLVFEYDKRDEEGNVIGSHRAIDGVDIDVPRSLLWRFLDITVQESLPWRSI